VSTRAPRQATWDDLLDVRDEEGYLLIVAAHGVARLRVPPFDAIELELGLLWGDRFDPNAPRGQEE
jgi:hypothetical protein